MRRNRALRVLRGSVAASVATFLALMSHVAGGGAAPGWLGVAVPWVLSVAICTLLAGRALSLVRLAVGVIASQLLFHGLFVLGAVAPGATATPGHHHGEALVLSAEAIGVPLAADPLMWIAHGIAAIITIAALYRGEHALATLLSLAARLGSWFGRAVARALAPLTPIGRGARLHVDVRHPAAPLGLRGGTVCRRGPPLLPVI
ncbi:hypothetical protein P0L94_02715 [Microbacter sp. GSS18]|nr:hypothetical protein P0L94_02715 [Microbacter sp. GSS18]